jgi:hypothetical protein
LLARGLLDIVATIPCHKGITPTDVDEILMTQDFHERLLTATSQVLISIGWREQQLRRNRRRRAVTILKCERFGLVQNKHNGPKQKPNRTRARLHK